MASYGVEGEPSTGYNNNLPHETKKLSLKRSRGKSGRQKDIIIKELRETIKQLKVQRRLRKQTTKRVREEKNQRVTKEVVHEKLSILRRQKNRKIFREYRRALRKQHRLGRQEDRLKRIRELEKQLEKERTANQTLLEREKARADKFKAALYRTRGLKRAKRYITIPAKLSAEEKRLKSIANKGIDVASYNVYVNSFRLVNFAKDNRITSDLLACMLQIELEGSVTIHSLRTGSRGILNRGVGQELLSVQPVGATKHYYLTVLGMEKVLELKKYIKRRKDFI